MELRHLKYFIAVAEELNFHRAAERLNVSQPPLSQQIKQLEEEIGAALFYRTNRVVTLTEAGKVFYERAITILEDAYQARRAARLASKGQTGTLRVNFVPSAAAGYLQKPVSTYRNLYPDVYLKLKQSTSREMPDEVSENKTDIALVRLPIKISDALNLQVIQKESLYAAVPIEHPFSIKEDISIEEIAKEPLITTPKSASPFYYEAVMSVFHGLKLDIIQEATEQFTIIGLAATGMGIGIVPEIMKHITIPGLKYIPIKETSGIIGLGAVTREEPNLLAQNFIDLFCKQSHISDTQR